MSDQVFSRRKVRVSALWSTVQQTVLLGSTAVIGVVLARTLSLQDFGLFTFVTTLSSMGMVVVTAGLSALSIKLLVNDPDAQGTTLANLLIIREGAAVVAYVILVGVAVSAGSDSALPLVLLALLVLFARAADFSEPWFQAEARSGEATPFRVSAIVLMLGLRVGVAIAGASVEVHLLLFVVESVVVASTMYWRFGRVSGRPRLHKPSLGGMSMMLSTSWILLLSGITAQINSRADIVVLQSLEGSEAVGIYAAAARLSELAYFLPVVFMTATFPRLLQVRAKHGAGSDEYRRELQKGYDAALWVGALIALIIYIGGGLAITILFGSDFRESVEVLRIHIVVLPFVFGAAVLSKWMVAEGLYAASLFRNFLGAAVNISLNFVLIPRMGIEGAAWATVASYVVASYLACWLYPPLWPAARQISLAFFAPVRVPRKLLNTKRNVESE